MKKLKKKVLRKILRIAMDAINDYDIDTFGMECDILRRHNIDLDMGAEGVPYIIYYNNKYKQTKQVKYESRRIDDWWLDEIYPNRKFY